MKYLSTLLLLLLSAAGFAQTAPDFTITNSDGQTKSLYADYLNQGKVVVIEAFFTTCPPCNAHAPYWQALYLSQLAAHPGRVEFIMLSTLQTDNNAKVAQYKASKGLTMPGVGSNGGSITALLPYMTGQFGEFLGTPTFILIDTDGQVVFDIRGASEQGTMDVIAQDIAIALTQNCSIQTPFGNPIPNVQVSATTSSMTANITANGTYTFSNLPQLQNTSYTISATKAEDNPLQGLTTFDLVKISQHIIGLDTFTQAWQHVAADMNCNNMVTTFDIVVGRKLILGIEENFTCNPWRFIPQGSNAQSNGGCVDLLGVRLGDITGPYFAPPPSERSAFSIFATDRFLTAGEQYSLELTAKEWKTIQSLQFDLDFDPNALKINSVEAPQLPGFDATCYRLPVDGEGRLPVLWLDGAAADLHPGQPLIRLACTALQNGKLSDLMRLRSARLPAEIYDAELRLWDINLQWQNAAQEHPFTGSLFPNPAKSTIQVYYNSPEAMDVRLQLIDLQGKIVVEKNVSFSKGDNWTEVRLENAIPGLHVVKVNGRSLGCVLVL